MRTWEITLLTSGLIAALAVKRGKGVLLSVAFGFGAAWVLDKVLSTRGNVGFLTPSVVDPGIAEGLAEG